MSRLYRLHYPLEMHRHQIESFLGAHPKGESIRKAILSLASDPRPSNLHFAEIDPEIELAILEQLPGIPIDDDLKTVVRRYVPRCRIEVEECEVIFDIDEKDGIVFLFKIQESKKD